MTSELEDIIALAETFECCPNCGSATAEQHYCSKCKTRFVERDDAHWFAEFLKKEQQLQQNTEEVH